MRKHHAMLAAVAVGAMIAPNAHAAAKKHAKHQAHAQPAEHHGNEAALKGEVDELKAEVAALREEIRAQRDTATTTQTQVATLQSQTTTATQTASTAAVKADTAVAKADAVQAAEVKTDKKVGAMAWAGDTKVGGTVFFNYSNVSQRANGQKQLSDGTGFNVKRVYISIDHKFNDMFSANITTDASNVIGETANNNYVQPATAAGAPTCTTRATPGIGTGYSTTCTAAAAANLGTASLVGKGFYVKKAYLQAKFSPALIVRAGASDTAWVPYIEGIYGHRYIENELLDEYKIGTSTDWGVQALGDLADGLVSYQVGVVNGAGYRNVKVTNSVDLEGRLSAQYKGFFAAVGGYTGRLGNNTEGTVLTHKAYRYTGAVGYKVDRFTIGGEYVYAKNYNSVITATEDTNEGWSAFGSFNVMPKWQVFGRYDWIRQTNITAATSVRNEYFNLGLQWEPVKLVDLSLVYKRASADNFGDAAGTIAWQNGTGKIGGTTNGTYDEFGLFGLFKF